MPPRLRSSFFLLATKAKNFFLGKAFEAIFFGHLFERHKALHGLANGLVIRQHAAEPSLADKRHLATPGMGLKGLTCGTFGANE